MKKQRVTINLGLALEYGTAAALVFETIAAYTEWNRAGGIMKDPEDGEYYMYHSVKAFERQYEGMTERRTKDAFQKLLDAGLIAKKRPPKGKNRTNRYRITEKGRAYIDGQAEEAPEEERVHMKEEDPEAQPPKKKEAPKKKETTYEKAGDIELETKTGSTWKCPDDLYEKLTELYPGKDVRAELKKMSLWLYSNPGKRKTETGMARFVSGWLGRTYQTTEVPTPAPAPEIDERESGWTKTEIKRTEDRW